MITMTIEQKYTFFNAALRDGHVMSTPVYEPPLEFVPSLVHEIRNINPEFCWIQFVFSEYDQMMSELLRVKRDLHDHMAYAESSREKLNGEKVERSELYREWYRTAKKKIDKIDKMRSSTASVLGIQGMWATSSSTKNLSKLSSLFSACTDDIDSLRLFEYKDARMLSALVNRSIVIDELPEYFRNYSKVTREEPPTLVLTQKEIPYYIHLPVEKTSIEELSESLASGASDSKPESADDGVFLANEKEKGVGTNLAFDVSSSSPSTVLTEVTKSNVCQIERLPVLEKQLDEAATARLGNLPSQTFFRSLEIVYTDNRFQFLLSSEQKGDLLTFQRQLSSIYGQMSFLQVDPIPEYVRTTVVDDFRNEVERRKKE